MVAGRFKVISVLAGKVKNRLRSDSVDFFDCPPPRHFTGITPGAVLPPIEPVVNKINFLGPLALFSSFAIHGALVVYALTFPLVSTSVPSQKTAMLLNVQLVEQVVLNDVKQQQVDVSPISLLEPINSDPQTTATINSPEEVKASPPVEALPITSSQPDTSQQENDIVDAANETQGTPQENVSVQNPVQVLTDPPESDDVVIVGGHAVNDAPSVKVAETEELTLEEPATPDYKPPQKLVAPDNPAPVRVKLKPSKGHSVRMLRERYVAKPAPVKVSAYRDNVLNHLAMVKPLGGSGAGTVVVAFSLSKTGDLQALRVARSSGNQILEAKALNAVRRAAPYPQPPQGVKRNQLLFNIPFYFQ